MEMKSLFISIHGSIESKEGKKITQKEMAKRIHCSAGTYQKYMQGTLNPKAINNIMCLLSMMENDDIVKMVKKWEKNARQKD